MTNEIHSNDNEFDMIQKIQQKLKGRFEPVNADYELKKKTELAIQDCPPDFNIEDWRWVWLRRKNNKLMGYIKMFGIFILILLLAFTLGIKVGTEHEENNKEQTSENIIYHNESPESVMIRYKYELGYESLDSLDNIGEPVYSLNINEDKIEAFTSTNLPVVSEAEKVEKYGVIERDFQVNVSDKVDKNKIRIDVKIVIEELKGGKWSPVYQAILMERGPYWSLDKGPIEFIKED